jgi:hypothetical protein
MADLKPKAFYGTKQTVLSSSSAISASNYSGTPTEFTNNDTSVPDAPYARAVLDVSMVSNPSGTVGFSLWALQKNVDGSNDDTTAPSGTSQNGAIYVGTFPQLQATTSAQRKTIQTIDIRGITAADFYVRNDTAVATTGTVTLSITPFTIGVTT